MSHGIYKLFPLALSICLGFMVSNHGNMAFGKSQPSSNSDKPKTNEIATIPQSQNELLLLVENSTVSIEFSKDVKDVTLAGNCTNHWLVSDNFIRQIAIYTTSKGISMRGDEYGAQIISGGKVYQLPTDPDNVIRNVSASNGKVVVNGKALKPLGHFDKKSKCDGPDFISLTFPDGYKGDFKIVAYSGAISINNWKSGNLTAILKKDSDLSIKNAENAGKVVIVAKGGSTAHISQLKADVFVADVEKDAAISVDNAKVKSGNATAEGSGTIQLVGEFEDFKKLVKGQGIIQVNGK